jgi:DNA-directed RNA polymerase beta subunit
MKITSKLGIKTKYDNESGCFLHLEDIIISLKYFLNLVYEKDGYRVDDIDHLENRRVRSV